MMPEESSALQNVDPDDLSEVFLTIERSFDISFAETNLEKVSTFGEFCDIVVAGIQLTHCADCTSQQAFYKIRKAIVENGIADKTAITPETSLETLFPRKTRRRMVRKFNRSLGFSMDLLNPKEFFSFWLLLFFFSLPGLYLNPEIGIGGICLAVLMLTIGKLTANTFDVIDVRELVDKMTREYHVRSRRDVNTINHEGVVQSIRQLFARELWLDPAVLTRDARF